MIWRRTKVIALAFLIFPSLISSAQYAACTYSDPTLSNDVYCAPGCTGVGGITYKESAGWGTPNSSSANSIYSATTQSLDCGRQGSNSGAPCASVSYYVVEENNVSCGICPNCGNPNCSNFTAAGCCDQTNGHLECGTGNVCSTCNNTCVAAGAQGYECCSTPDCKTGLICTGGSCQPPPQPPTCGPAGTNCTNSNCVPPTCPELQEWNPALCECYQYSTPIIIDTDGSGFHLTSAANGVFFDFLGNGKPFLIAWTAPGSTNGWLALDLNGNGLIDSGKELFGNITAQPLSDDRNGFLALAVYDEPENGGNGDGIIDHHDAVWSKLLVWIDANHDGISQAQELHHLDDIGIHSIGLMYTESQRVDAYGNEFRYKGYLNPEKGDGVNRVIYDVILTSEE